MVTDNSIRDSLFKMFNAMFGENRKNFAFPDDANEAYLQAFHNNSNRPDAQTLLYYYIDNIDAWKGARHAGQMSTYDRNENTAQQQMMRQFDCVVDIYSKQLGVAMDTMTFLVAVLRGDRWEDLLVDENWFLGKESVSEPISLRELENSTWNSRCRCRIRLNFRDTITLYEELLELQMPSVISDMNTITPVVGESIS